jgi:M6 family metalloprotease-like protein
MKKRNIVYIVLLFIIAFNYCYALPAKHTLMSIVQNDKRHLSFYLYGDEKLSYAKTLDNYTLLVNNEGKYCYAVLDKDNNLVPSPFVAVNQEERTNEENSFLRQVATNLTFSQNQLLESQNKMQNAKSSYPTTGTNNLLVILVSFADRPFTHTQQEFQNILSLHNYSYDGATGSVKDYYYDNSFGQLNLNPTVVGPFTLSHNMAYYGATGTSFSDCNPKAMISEACQLADSLIDFTQFDMNHDSIIDAVHVIFAGQPQSSTGETDAIWPHRWTIYDGDTVQKYFDGMRLKDYSCSAERRGAGIDGIGTICHEFGHVLGLPDYYDTDYQGSGGDATALASWSIMSAGSYNNNGNTPPIFNTNERMKLHWINVDTLNTMNTYTLYPLIDSNRAYILTTDSTNEYFLIENRSQTSWDSYIPNKGVLIYHIKDLGDNCINCNPSFQRCDIVEADNDDSQGTLSSDVFTYPTNNHFFTSYDSPYCHLWNDTIINRPITRIALDTNGIASFRFLMPDTNAIVKTLFGSQEISSTSFKIKGLRVYDGINQNPNKGFLLSTSSSFSNTIFYAADSNNLDTFFCTLSSLAYNQIYYYKAAALVNNNLDTVVGNVYSFQTPSGLPYISCSPITEIGLDTIAVSTTKLINGDFPITEYGIIYDTVSVLDTTHNKISFNGDFSSFNTTINNLEQATTYYFRAYALTSIGIKYSNTVSARTKFIPIEDNVIGENIEKCIGEDFDSITTNDVSGGKGNYSYLWQEKQDTTSWHNASNVNTLRDYYIGSINENTRFRRIVFSFNIKDTSNVILAKVNQSKGGNILGKDSIDNNNYDTLILKNNVGEIISWEENNNGLWFDINNSSLLDTISFLANNIDSVFIRTRVQYLSCPISYSDTLKINVKQNTALINYFKEKINYYLNPIPANKEITLFNKNKEFFSFEIYDINGKKLFKSNDTSSIQTNINTTGFEKGNYLIKIFSHTQNKTITLKFIIAR